MSSWSALPEHLDLIVASDVVWAKPFIDPFLNVLDNLVTISSRGSSSGSGIEGEEEKKTCPEILFAHKSRDPSVEDAFFEEAATRGFIILETLVSGGLTENNEYFHPRVTLYKLGKKGSKKG